MNRIILVGTSHEYQLLGQGKGHVEKFEELLTFLCKTHSPKAIAEEMNPAALEEKGATNTVACSLASKLHIQHQFSDPEPSIRRQLGMYSENDIRAQGWLKSWDAAKVEAEILASYSKRELYWFEQLKILNCWPVIFICGADHCDSFSGLLRSNGFCVDISIPDWAPNLSPRMAQ